MFALWTKHWLEMKAPPTWWKLKIKVRLRSQQTWLAMWSVLRTHSRTDTYTQQRKKKLVPISHFCGFPNVVTRRSSSSLGTCDGTFRIWIRWLLLQTKHRNKTLRSLLTHHVTNFFPGWTPDPWYHLSQGRPFWGFVGDIAQIDREFLACRPIWAQSHHFDTKEGYAQKACSSHAASLSKPLIIFFFLRKRCQTGLSSSISATRRVHERYTTYLIWAVSLANLLQPGQHGNQESQKPANLEAPASLPSFCMEGGGGTGKPGNLQP